MVMVSHKHNFIYLKTRKTAGTSVEMALEPLCVPPGTPIVQSRKPGFSEYGIVGRRGGKWQFRDWRSFFRFIEWRNHQSAAFVRRMIGKVKWETHTKITAVRNPFDRMVSHFHYENHRRAKQDPDFNVIRSQFKDFLQSRRCRDDQEIATLDGKYIIDHGVRMEHIREDLHRVTRELDLPFEDEWLPYTNKQKKMRKGRETAEYYDPETIEIVKRRQAWVFENFDYPTEP